MQLQGTIGNKGICRGKVKIIKNTSDYLKIEPGDILVLEQGKAEIIQYINIIAGIITDHGGLTSHAALLAREHDIPCILGTQNATSILSNGQMVELNANLGTITII